MFVCLFIFGLLIASTLQQSHAAAVCSLPQDVGPCDGLMMRYYYNTSSKQCENFYYGGCQGNSNNFNTLMECVMKCQNI